MLQAPAQPEKECPPAESPARSVRRPELTLTAPGPQAAATWGSWGNLHVFSHPERRRQTGGGLPCKDRSQGARASLCKTPPASRLPRPCAQVPAIGHYPPPPDTSDPEPPAAGFKPIFLRGAPVSDLSLS